MPTTGEIVQAVLSIAGIGGGVVGGANMLRAWGQNRNERAATLTAEQQEFRKSQRESIVSLEKRNEYLTGRIDSVDHRNGELVQANSELKAQIALQEHHIELMADRLTVAYHELHKFKSAAERLEERLERQDNEVAQLRRELASCMKRPKPRKARVGAVEHKLDTLIASNEVAHAAAVESQAVTAANTVEMATNSQEVAANTVATRLDTEARKEG